MMVFWQIASRGSVTPPCTDAVQGIVHWMDLQ